MSAIRSAWDYAADLEMVCDHLDKLAEDGGDVPDWTESYDRVGVIIEGLKNWQACLAFPGNHRAAIYTRVAPNLRKLAAQLRVAFVYEAPAGEPPEAPEAQS